MSRYVTNPVQDSEEQATQNYKVCQIDKPRAAMLAEETVAIWTSGTYIAETGALHGAIAIIGVTNRNT